MDEFELDPELHGKLKAVRENVRRLFEQLRLKSEDGDISGKERLERVPAFAKRNFRNLAGPNPQLAIKQAWRLIDFLEGSAEARLSLLAREALRAVELDRQLAALRASQGWTEAAGRLREALGAAREDMEPVIVPGRSAAEQDRAEAGPSVPGSGDGPGPDRLPGAKQGDAEASPRSARTAGRIAPMFAAVGMLGALGAIWLRDPGADPRFACLALETASSSALAAHWSVSPAIPVPRPGPGAGRPDPIMFTISDPANGGPVRSIFTTSQYSFAEGTDPDRPGGGKADVRLRVGGWGDTYLSLLKFPIPDNRLVRRAVVRLVVLGDDPTSRPTTMTLRTVNDPWDVPPGPQHRLWWRSCPRSEAIRRNLPAPGPPESIYDIDITDIYNWWARGLQVNQGIMLEPEHIGSYGANRERYANFSTFYSTRAIDPSKRPKLILIH